MRDFNDASLRGDMGFDGKKSEFHEGWMHDDDHQEHFTSVGLQCPYHEENGFHVHGILKKQSS